MPKRVSTPTSFKAESTGPTSITISWNGTSGADAYNIQKREYKESWSDFPRFGSYSRSYIDEGLKSNTRYEYRIRAVDGDRTSRWSSVISATTKKPTDPSPDPDPTPVKPDSPTNVKGSRDGDQSIVSWDKVDNVDKYKVYRNNSYLSDSSDLIHRDPTNKTNNYYVTSVRNNLESDPSNVVEVKVSSEPEPSPIPIPQNIEGSRSNDGYSVITWNSIPNAKYKVYRDSKYLADSTDNMHRDLTSSTHTYYITSVISDSESNQSSSVTVVVSGPVPSPEPDPEPDPVTPPSQNYDKNLPPVTKLLKSGDDLTDIPDGQHWKLSDGVVFDVPSNIRIGKESILSTNVSNPAVVRLTGRGNWPSIFSMKSSDARIYGIKGDAVYGSEDKVTMIKPNANRLRIEYCSWTDKISRFVIAEGDNLPYDLLVWNNRSNAILGGARKEQYDIYGLFLSKGTGPWIVAGNSITSYNHFTFRVHGASGNCLLESNVLNSPDLGDYTNIRNVALRGTLDDAKIVARNNKISGGAFEIGYDTNAETYRRIEVIENEFKEIKLFDIVGSPNGTFNFSENTITGKAGYSSLLSMKKSYGANVAPSGTVYNNIATNVNATKLFSRIFPSTVKASGNVINGKSVNE